MRRDAQRERGVRQIEGDARRLVDGERQRLGRRAAQVQLELHLLAGQRLNVDGLELDRVGGLRDAGDRRKRDEQQRSDHRRSCLESDHASILPVASISQCQ